MGNPVFSNNNIGRIFEIIRSHDRIYRAEIARMTDLSIPTVMRITDNLIQEGFVYISGKGASSGGKPPELLEIVPDARYSVGLDMSDDRYNCVVMDLKGNLVARKSLEKHSGETGGEALTGKGLSLVRDLLGTVAPKPGQLMGIGLGVPGIVSTEQGTVYSQNLRLDGYPITEAFFKAFDVPVFVDNTAKVTAIAEQWYGNGKKYGSFILIALGHGIGAAIIMDGEVYRGRHNMSGELGHTVVDRNGPLCRCGKRGCLEGVASNSAVQRQAQQMLSEGFDSIMTNMVEGDVGRIRAKHVFDAAMRGDEIALLIANNAVGYIAMGIENMVSLFDIRHYILSGRIIQDSRWMLQSLQEGLQSGRTPYIGADEITLEPAFLGNEAAAVGAAVLPLKAFIAALGAD